MENIIYELSYGKVIINLKFSVNSISFCNISLWKGYFVGLIQRDENNSQENDQHKSNKINYCFLFTYNRQSVQ